MEKIKNILSKASADYADLRYEKKTTPVINLKNKEISDLQKKHGRWLCAQSFEKRRFCDLASLE